MQTINILKWGGASSSQCRQNMAGFLAVGGGTRIPSEHCQGTLEQCTQPPISHTVEGPAMSWQPIYGGPALALIQYVPSP